MKDIHFAIVNTEHEWSRHHEVTVDDYPGPVATALLGRGIHENPLAAIVPLVRLKILH